MLGRNIGLTISCALGASAFLLPPGTSATTANEGVSLVPFEIDAKNQLVELPCSSCAFSVNADRVSEEQGTDAVFWTQGGANNLILNFTVSDDDNTLLLNGGQIYPLKFELLPGWKIQQVPASTTRAQLASGDFLGTSLEVTGYQLHQGPVDVLSPDGDSIVAMSLKLDGLEGQSMTVDDVLIQMIQTSDGELLILAIEPIPGTARFELPSFDGPKPPKFKGGPEKFRPRPKPCDLPGPLCAIGDFFESTFGSLKPHRMGCGGGKPAPFADGPLPPHFGPGLDFSEKPGHPHGPPHGPPHGHHHKHGFLHRVSHAILAILAPAMAGVAVGVVVSVLGLLTGRFIGWLWFTVIRGGKRGGYKRVAAEDIVITVTDVDSKDTSRVILDDVEAEQLPRYEDAPAYEQTEKEVL